MKSEEKTNELMINRKKLPSLQESNSTLPAKLASRFELYPENKRRPVNKTLFKNEYFQLTYNTRDDTMAIASRGDLVYSAIPYDTARNYIQRGAIQYLLHPEEVRSYIESHKTNLEKYLMLSIFQTTQKRVTEDSPEVQQAYQAIFENPLLEIQILGRLMQHDETGPLSANLAGKFLFSENVKTGIAGYISEYLNFVVQLTQALPVMIEGSEIQLLGDSAIKNKPLTVDSDITTALELLPQPVNEKLKASLLPVDQGIPVNTQPLLRSEYGEELSRLRENYIAHSVHPDEAEKYFKNVHSTENCNLINVVSDIHSKDGKLPFVNHHFNILAGDVSESHVTDADTKGIYLIGGHELIDVLPENSDLESPEWDQWRPFFKYQWFKELAQDSDEQWYLLPTGAHDFYRVVQSELQKRFPQMAILNNESYMHDGVRYIGLTLPMALVERKQEQQRFILAELKRLLGEDQKIPTVIVSHAPLFNELSILTPQSSAYNKEYTCEEPKIEQLFADYNIIGAIHGHHHIPASSRRFHKVDFAGKRLFVVCSIYSKINTGFDLTSLLEN